MPFRLYKYIRDDVEFNTCYFYDTRHFEYVRDDHKVRLMAWSAPPPPSTRYFMKSFIVICLNESQSLTRGSPV